MKKTKTQINAEQVRANLEAGETVIISARYGRSDHNGCHVRAVDDAGRVLARTSGGGYDLRSEAMWAALVKVTKCPTDQATGNGSDRFGCIYANFGTRWVEFFAQFGWRVEVKETSDRKGRGLDYIAIIKKEA